MTYKNYNPPIPLDFAESKIPTQLFIPPSLVYKTQVLAGCRWMPKEGTQRERERERERTGQGWGEKRNSLIEGLDWHKVHPVSSTQKKVKNSRFPLKMTPKGQFQK